VIYVTHDLNHAAQMDSVVYLKGLDGNKSYKMSADQFEQELDDIKGDFGVSLS